MSAKPKAAPAVPPTPAPAQPAPQPLRDALQFLVNHAAQVIPCSRLQELQTVANSLAKALDERDALLAEKEAPPKAAEA